MIPPEISGWCLLGAKYKVANLYTRADYENYVRELPESAIEELILFYRKASVSAAQSQLEKWLKEVRSIPQTPEERLVRNLASVFGYLGRRGYQELKRYAFDRLPKPITDWSKLPMGFEFL